MNEPNISVLMTSYNNENTIEEAIKSVLNQTYKNVTLLILDDCSSDNTYKIIKKIKETNKNLKIFRNKKNIGLTKSLNILIQESKGEILARQDGDDVSFPKRIEKQIDYLSRKKLQACTSRAVLTNNKRKIPKFSHLLPNSFVIKYKNPFIHGTLMIKKSLLIEIGLYDERFIYAQDYQLFKKILDKNIKVGLIREPLYKLNMENNISSIKKNEQKYYADCVRLNKSP